MENQERIIGSVIRRAAQVDSTNSRLRQTPNLQEGAVLCADRQTNGRGRFNRAWFSTIDSLTFSFLLRPRIDMRHLPLLALFPAVSIAQVLHALDFEATLKWPNDIELNGSKVGGILVENVVKSDRSIESIVGIGINVNQNIHDIPEQIRPHAASLMSVAGHTFNKEEIFAGLLNRLDKDYQHFFRPLQAEALRVKWLSFCGHLNRTVTVTGGGEKLTGNFVDLTESGAAVLDVDGHNRIIENFDLIEESHAVVH